MPGSRIKKRVKEFLHPYQIELILINKGNFQAMARPIEFDYDSVLENAMQQFWRDGYEASSVQKLLDATGINRGTLYNSFGDKDTFFYFMC